MQYTNRVVRDEIVAAMREEELNVFFIEGWFAVAEIDPQCFELGLCWLKSTDQRERLALEDAIHKITGSRLEGQGWPSYELGMQFGGHSCSLFQKKLRWTNQGEPKPRPQSGFVTDPETGNVLHEGMPYGVHHWEYLSCCSASPGGWNGAEYDERLLPVMEALFETGAEWELVDLYREVSSPYRADLAMVGKILWHLVNTHHIKGHWRLRNPETKEILAENFESDPVWEVYVREKDRLTLSTDDISVIWTRRRPGDPWHPGERPDGLDEE